MKTLIVMAAFLAATGTTVFAQQNSALEIKNLKKEVINNDKNQFKLFSHEELEVDLNFTLDKSASYTVAIFDNKDQLVYTKKIEKEGRNRVYFRTEQDKEYTVKLYGEKDVNLVALLNRK